MGRWLWIIIWAECRKIQSFFELPHILCSDKKRTAPKPSFRVTKLITYRKRNSVLTIQPWRSVPMPTSSGFPGKKHSEDGRNTFFRKFVDFYTTTWQRSPEDITATAVEPRILRCTSYTNFSNCVPARPSAKNGWRQGKVLGSKKVMWWEELWAYAARQKGWASGV
jgi:hypothetical protein